MEDFALEAEKFQKRSNEEMNQEPNQEKGKTCIGLGFPETSVGPRKQKRLHAACSVLWFRSRVGWSLPVLSALLLLLRMLFAPWMH